MTAEASPSLQAGQQQLDISGQLGREVRWADLLEQALTVPGSLGTTYNRFYQYSFLNQVLLYMQGVNEPVATYRRWQEMGRQVQKGSTAKSILRPIFYKETDEAGEEVQRLRGFKMVKCLFTASQTEGEPLPDVQLPAWDKQKALGALAISEVAFEHLDGNAQGFSAGREFAVNPVAAYPLKTMFHEVGHIVLGHTTGDNADYAAHRGIKEFQAEATAYLCMTELDLTEHMDVAASRGYVQHWLSGERPDDGAIRQVFTATDQVLRAGRPQ